MATQLRRQRHHHPRADVALHQLADLVALEQRLHRRRQVRRGQAVAGDGGTVEVDDELRHGGLLLVRQVHDAGHLGQHLARPAPRGCAGRPGRGPNTLTARLVRLPEIMWSMRWLIGWPKVTFTPGSVATARRRSAKSSSLSRPGRGVPGHLHLGGVDPLDVLVLLRPAGAAAGRDHLREAPGSPPPPARPSSSLSASEMPGALTTETVRDPSLNGGRKLRPRTGTTAQGRDQQQRSAGEDQPAVTQRQVAATGR